MKRIAWMVLISLGLSTAALAQGPRDRDRDHGNQGRAQSFKHKDKHDERWRDGRHNDRFDQYNARGPEWRRGKPIPPGWRNRQYIITDYRTYHLKPPPRGHQWVQVGPDLVLMAIATGIIVDLVLNN
jgi:Ni/Co efflux regulator RcnB